jgi:hypothetical protein
MPYEKTQKEDFNGLNDMTRDESRWKIGDRNMIVRYVEMQSKNLQN